MEPKNIPDPGFAGDAGAADPRLAEALDAYAAGRTPGTEAAVLAALAGARLLVPVVAVLGGAGTGPDGLRREKTSDMAVPTLRAPGGRKALPAFTSVGTLARWRADARPVAVHTRQALEAVAHEDADTLVLDLAGPVTYQLTGAALRALAEGRIPVDAISDPDVAEAVRTAVAAEPSVVRAHLVPRDGADAAVGLVLAADAPVREVAARLATALAGDEVLRSRLVRGLELALLPAGAQVAGKQIFAR